MLKSDALFFVVLFYVNSCAGSANICSHLTSDLAKGSGAEEIPILFCNLSPKNRVRRNRGLT